MPQVVVITGANCGIGLETARALLASGATVLLACRSESKAAEAIENIKKTVNSPNVVSFFLL